VNTWIFFFKYLLLKLNTRLSFFFLKKKEEDEIRILYRNKQVHCNIYTKLSQIQINLENYESNKITLDDLYYSICFSYTKVTALLYFHFIQKNKLEKLIFRFQTK
jgi:hypothetical protein